MKYLIITKTKDIYYMLPDERRMVLMAAAVAFTEKLVKAHKMKEVHVMPGCYRTNIQAQITSNHLDTPLVGVITSSKIYDNIQSYFRHNSGMATTVDTIVSSAS